MSSGNLRPLTLSMIRYGFSDVLTEIDVQTRKSLKKEINSARSMMSAVRFRRAITEMYSDVARDLDEYIGKKSNPQHKYATLVLLSANLLVYQRTRHFLHNVEPAYTTRQIAEIIGADNTQLLSKQIHEFTRNRPGNFLFSQKHARNIKIFSRKVPGKNLNVWTSQILSEGKIREEKVERVLFIARGGTERIQNLAASEAGVSIRDVINDWSPHLVLHDGHQAEIVDAYIFYYDDVRHIRLYDDGDHVVHVFDRKVESAKVPEVSLDKQGDSRPVA